VACRPAQRRRFTNALRPAPCSRSIARAGIGGSRHTGRPSKTPSASHAEIAFDYGAPDLTVVRTDLEGNCLSASLCP